MVFNKSRKSFLLNKNPQSLKGSKSLFIENSKNCVLINVL